MDGKADYYSGEGDAQSEGSGGEPQKPDEKADSNTALLPKSLFGDAEPEVGAEIKLKVVHSYGDEVEVECCKDGDLKKSSAMDEAEKKLGDMATMETE